MPICYGKIESKIRFSDLILRSRRTPWVQSLPFFCYLKQFLAQCDTTVCAHASNMHYNSGLQFKIQQFVTWLFPVNHSPDLSLARAHPISYANLR